MNIGKTYQIPRSSTEVDMDGLLQYLKTKKFRTNADMPESPPYCIYIEDEDKNQYGIAVPGSVVEVSGQMKTRKSTYMGAIAAACLSKTGSAFNINTKGIAGKNIMYFDTEQNMYEFHVSQTKILKTAGYPTGKGAKHPPNYFAYNLREFDEETRFDIIDTILSKLDQDFLDNIGIVFIDGIADLIISTDASETRSLVTRITYWADSLKCPIVVAIHTNKDGENSTGHLGGFLDKKCSYHIRTEIEGGSMGQPTKVSCRHARLGEVFPDFLFRHDSLGQPEIVRKTLSSLIGINDLVIKVSKDDINVIDEDDLF